MFPERDPGGFMIAVTQSEIWSTLSPASATCNTGWIKNGEFGLGPAAPLIRKSLCGGPRERDTGSDESPDSDEVLKVSL